MKNNKTLLAKWLSGTLNKAELEAFERSKDFELYQRIANVSGKLKVPSPNLEEKLAQQKKYNASRSKKISAKPWLYGVAASLAVLFGLLLFQNNDTNIKTLLAETKRYTLPDGSIVTLNADSEITFNLKDFLKKRHIKMRGEAYFQVKKGRSFAVLSSSGSVQVLGTAFNVYDRDSNYKVHCDEGKVSVKTKLGKEIIITKSEATFLNKKNSLSLAPADTPSPQWRTGKSVFTKATLVMVLKELERQFAVKIEHGNIDSSRKYTGYFYHKNLEEALNQICKPMNISFKINDNSIILINK